ncbi:hypothetical protein SPRG_03366 [Saprolegnia parasitica CBS 223.65]|uniref:START domain-containing protein n=1 Tax=Saprolegnia parasitica (strain CBS 223.65) TaxID=695850 RepID=A0A067CN79_SAPPC|nr:hypothetical protein SPRG_03366 [Saprolegnia parasitica CBS 223.65]KDO32149.1 hypothetical protein SPRG_03366 [Saprolegnia parasitica CBS 223.65]|eukprot:XP_012197333.1 hypothetical protein SPRG_03366 [Saprolegnia parasitica CBS 223.65]
MSSPVTSDESCDDAQRVRKREKQRDFRRKVHHQLEFLRGRVAHLETQLRAARARKAMVPLSWCEVARALKADVVATKGVRKSLLAQAEDHAEFLEAMVKWVQSLSPERPPSRFPLWYNVGLCGSNASRRAALDWITQHMYHHTPMVLQHMGFHPTDTTPSQAFIFDNSKGYIEYIYTDRRIHCAATLAQVLAAYQRLYYANSVDFVVAGRQVMDQDELGKDFIYSRREFKNENVVHREFVSEHQIVHVQHSIHDDSKHPLGAIHRHRMAWIVLEAVSPTMVVETKVFQKSQSWTEAAGYVSVDEEARIVGVFEEPHMDQDDYDMLPPSVQEAQLRQHVTSTLSRCMQTLNGELEMALQQLDLEEAQAAIEALPRDASCCLY